MRTSRFPSFRLAVFLLLLTQYPAWSAVTVISPAGYGVEPLLTGSSPYTDTAVTVTNIPPALAGGTLCRTAQADALNPSLSIQLANDQRCEVYVCCDSRAQAPGWLASWVRTDMVVGVSDPNIEAMHVYARRFPAGVITLGANQAQVMYFVVVRPSVIGPTRHGWILLSYDVPYLLEIISQAPVYGVNHIQLSHDIVMYTHEITGDADRRAVINTVIDWAHAYGVPEVTLWTHEASTVDADPSFFSEGDLDGNNENMWNWMRGRYEALFSAESGCPEADGVVLTFDELSMFGQGVEVYDRTLFKHVGFTPTDSVEEVVKAVQQVCAPRGKTLYARTWAGSNQATIRDALLQNGDPAVWLMNKNVGAPDPSLLDWQFMDTHHPMIGGLPAPYKEMVEFDIGGEYLGRGRYTFAMTAYLQDHWNYARAQDGADGAVARIDREGSLPYHGANRLSLHGFKEILANPGADPVAINLAWCQQQFPPEAAQDIADAYDAPGSPWLCDTRYMTWEAFAPGLSPITNAEGRSMALTAIARLDRNRAQLEMQSTLDTRGGTSDYQTLRNGIALPLLELGGALPAAAGFSNFRPAQTGQSNPTCFIDITAASPGLNISSVRYEYSVNGGSTWSPWSASTTGMNGSTTTETITAASIPFGGLGESNRVRFFASNLAGQNYQSNALRVAPYDGPVWEGFAPVSTSSLTPDCTIRVTAGAKPLNLETARYVYSIDGGIHWLSPPTDWTYRYECDQLPLAAGWSRVEGKSGYESLQPGGIVRINDSGTNPGDKVKYARSWAGNASAGATVLARIRCAAGGHFFASNLGLADGQHAEYLYLKANGILGLAQSNLLVPETTGDWHTYRVTIHGQDVNVYVDESPHPAVRGTQAYISPSADQWVMIGSGASAATQDVYYDYVYWTTQGAFAPGQGYPAASAGDSGSATLTAQAVAFNQASPDLNVIRFVISDVEGTEFDSPVYTVVIGAELPTGDFDNDGDVDVTDFAHMQTCFSGSAANPPTGCEDADLDSDSDVDAADFQRLASCMAGAGKPPGC